MTYANNKLHVNHELNCTKCQECKSGIQQLDNVTEKEDECMLWYRRFEDAKEADLRVLPKHGSVEIIT